MSHLTIWVVSGGAGVSGTQIVRTAVAQFQQSDVSIVTVPHVRTSAEIESAVAQAAAGHGLIVHTLVNPSLREAMYASARHQHVVAIDLMGPLLSHLAERLGQEPAGQPGLYRQLNEDYFRRVEAIEFTVQHDDGRRVQELDQAEIVLVGPSRVSKTPLSIYLSTRGWKVGNVPVILNVPLPPKLFELDRRRVIGLTVRPERLAAIRRQRAERLSGQPLGDYASPEMIFHELAYAHEQFQRGGWPVIDMTHKSIEDAAAEVVALVTRQAGG
ncbi:MAG: pyruvate, water dikinase regulatory protein [Anaerolineae bacterium]|nr:kinase/pyrophosphorylase [Anaerolineae bacterium]MDW8099599.1 pyruvate, water dikinase regulatory protein [Anaerolineae bacterium]